ncbi:hypothetical protein ACHAXS_007046 [Conticribra weissflogii]
MLTRPLKAIAVSSVVAFVGLAPTTTNAQFGVGGRNRPKGGAATFEELNKLAAERMEAGKNGGLEDLLGDMNLGDLDFGSLMKDLDPEVLQDLVMEGLKDPQIQEMFSGMQGAMNELLNMDTDQLKKQMEEAMNMLTSMDMQESILQQKDEVLAMMEAQGTATPEEIAEYRANPAKFQEAMTQAFGQMKDIFSDPKSLDSVVQMMKSFGAVMQDPAGAMSKLGGVLQDALADDDKIEAARLQLLSDPSVAGNKAVSDMFGSEEMQEILNDPVKWRTSVKEGQRMLMGDAAGARGGIGMGEL